MKTNELTGAALDWAVAKCEGESYVHGETDHAIDGRTFQRGTAQKQGPHYSTDWSHGGPIIEREGIYLWKPHGVNGAWSAMLEGWPAERVIHDDKPLIAAMRCYVASRLGDEVEVPEELKP